MYDRNCYNELITCRYYTGSSKFLLLWITFNATSLRITLAAVTPGIVISFGSGKVSKMCGKEQHSLFFFFNSIFYTAEGEN